MITDPFLNKKDKTIVKCMIKVPSNVEFQGANFHKTW